MKHENEDRHELNMKCNEHDELNMKWKWNKWNKKWIWIDMKWTWNETEMNMKWRWNENEMNIKKIINEIKMIRK